MPNSTTRTKTNGDEEFAAEVLKIIKRMTYFMPDRRVNIC